MKKNSREIIKRLEEQGLIEVNGPNMRITPKGANQLHQFFNENEDMAFLIFMHFKTWKLSKKE